MFLAVQKATVPVGVPVHKAPDDVHGIVQNPKVAVVKRQVIDESHRDDV